MAGRGIQLELETHVATLGWMKGGGVGQTIRREIEGEQPHVPTGVDDRPIIVVQLGCGLPPHVWQEHGGFSSLVGGGGLQQTSVAIHVFGAIVVHQFQGILVRVFFAIDGHADDGQPKLFKAEGTTSSMAIEGIVVQQPHDHADGHTTGEESVLIKVHQAIGHGKVRNLEATKGYRAAISQYKEGASVT